jgi:hypothetical protein
MSGTPGACRGARVVQVQADDEDEKEDFERTDVRDPLIPSDAPAPIASREATSSPRSQKRLASTGAPPNSDASSEPGSGTSGLTRPGNAPRLIAPALTAATAAAVSSSPARLAERAEVREDAVVEQLVPEREPRDDDGQSCDQQPVTQPGEIGGGFRRASGQQEDPGDVERRIGVATQPLKKLKQGGRHQECPEDQENRCPRPRRAGRPRREEAGAVEKDARRQQDQEQRPVAPGVSEARAAKADQQQCRSRVTARRAHADPPAARRRRQEAPERDPPARQANDGAGRKCQCRCSGECSTCR